MVLKLFKSFASSAGLISDFGATDFSITLIRYSRFPKKSRGLVTVTKLVQPDLIHFLIVLSSIRDTKSSLSIIPL